jgi:murein DD-endopeptidase MepM/ murein hydrolase activator NlpD
MFKTILIVTILLLILSVYLLVVNQGQSARLMKQKNEIEALTNYVQNLQDKLNTCEQERQEGVEIPKSLQIRELLDSYLRERETQRPDSEPVITTEELRQDLEEFRMKQRFIPNSSPILDDYVISQGFTPTHKGVDLAAPLGTEIVAAGSGVIKSVYEDKYFGNVMVIDHLNHYLTFYAHLARIFHLQNFFVEKGQTIGLVGNTGLSTNPHLHFEVIYRGKNIDPLTVIEE